MKVPPATLEAMRDAIAPLDTPTVRGAYLRGEFPRAELVKDLDRQYRCHHWRTRDRADRLTFPPYPR